jgi:hypothetical protein
VEGIVRSKEAEMAALVTKHREELLVARGQPRQARPAVPPVPEQMNGHPCTSVGGATMTGNGGAGGIPVPPAGGGPIPALVPAPFPAGAAPLYPTAAAAAAIAPAIGPVASDSLSGTASVSGRPTPKGALVAASPAPRTFHPQLDVPKSSAPLPPPLPSNWERHQLGGGKLALLVEALPGLEAPDEEEGGYRFYVRVCAPPY